MALSANSTRRQKMGHGFSIALPVAASQSIYRGALVAVNSSGLAVPAANTEGLKVAGVCTSNSGHTIGSATAGSLSSKPFTNYVTVETGVFSFDVAGSPVAGSSLFVTDDDDLTQADTTQLVYAGVVLGPDQEVSGNYWVQVDGLESLGGRPESGLLEPAAGAGPTALAITAKHTKVVLSDPATGDDAYSVADANDGDTIDIVLAARTGAGNAVITPATYANGTTITLDAAAERWYAVYGTGGWRNLYVTGTVA